MHVWQARSKQKWSGLPRSWNFCMQCASAERARARVRDDAGDYLCLCEAWKFSLSVRKPCKAQDAAFFLLPKWVFRELTVRWLM